MEKTKQKILIAGIGGVGGYFGGLLSKAYENDSRINIYFFARSTHLKKIQENGLKIIKGGTEFTTRPTLATDDPKKIGVVDVLIVCTKTYGLEEIMCQLLPCIDDNTLILPLLNGVDSRDRLIALLPNNEILNGCVYIISKIKEPGVIENFGNIQSLYFGIDHRNPDRFLQLETLLKKAEVEATHTDNISKVIWEKYIFISATATATSYFDKTLGEILIDTNKRGLLINLISEVTQIALAKKIDVSADIETKTLIKLESFPFETTSSMQRDFRQNKQTEVTSLTAYVVQKGIVLNVRTTTYKKMLRELINS